MTYKPTSVAQPVHRPIDRPYVEQANSISLKEQLDDVARKELEGTVTKWLMAGSVEAGVPPLAEPLATQIARLACLSTYAARMIPDLALTRPPATVFVLPDSGEVKVSFQKPPTVKDLTTLVSLFEMLAQRWGDITPRTAGLEGKGGGGG